MSAEGGSGGDDEGAPRRSLERRWQPAAQPSASPPPLPTERPPSRVIPQRVPEDGASRFPAWPGVPGAGTRLAGTYEVIRSLGEGAMGVVLLGKDVHLERQVAIKLIHPEYLSTEDARHRFLLEARAMARVRHENVVEIYAFGDHAGAPYFVMEYVPGVTLEAWMHQRDTLSIDEAIGVLEQICRGVSAIHLAGTIHRDLKLANVLMGPAFRVAVTDLGLSRILDKPITELSNTISGTPAYMAPEIIRGDRVPSFMHDRADVYSLGVMAFELLTGRLPFETGDAVKMMEMHMHDPPPLPSEFREDLPSAFDEVVRSALHKEPMHRTQSARAFREALLAARESARKRASGLRLLVADDDEDFAALVSETLEWAFPGAEIVSVRDGAAALAAVDNKPADLAVLDLDMPGLNGIELTAAFRASSHAEHMPILVVTATGGAPDWRLLSSLGADGFLVKPIDPMALVALARRTLEKG